MRRPPFQDGVVFLTQVVRDRERLLADPATAQRILDTLRRVKELQPFRMVAWVLLPDHLHLLIRPEDGATFSAIMHSFKRNTTLEHKKALGIPGHCELWQKSFHDHMIRDLDDFNAHMDYIHYNPVRHGLCTKPEDWPHSSYREWVKRSAYEIGWGWSLTDLMAASWRPLEPFDPV